MDDAILNRDFKTDQLFQCPACGASLKANDDGFSCASCKHQFTRSDGIDQLYWPNEWDAVTEDVTDRVKAFYEDRPFPDYDELDTLESLERKARKGLFARLLDEQVPAGAHILECGCGTAQLSNFLSIRKRQVIAADLCLNSLRLGQQFASQHDLHNIRFVQMNLFKPPFNPESFHLVISNGVLHHTSDPRSGFREISRLVKPGGFILIGLYHYWGRLITDTRRIIFNVTQDRFKFLDPNLRSASTSDVKKAAWFNDQYKHPHESKHTIREVYTWLEQDGFEFVKSIPSTRLFRDFSADENLFVEEPPAGNGEALLKEMAMMFKGSQEGGFFTIIGRKRSAAD